jgi:hypothetical protein
MNTIPEQSAVCPVWHGVRAHPGGHDIIAHEQCERVDGPQKNEESEQVIDSAAGHAQRAVKKQYHHLYTGDDSNHIDQ